ncbi:MbtH family protein [Embleya sp. NBC_00896]|uniref:MbtH family protein n=1 Tax=Embleya sp. NBC_00896 TaxID=2975961 RepID=UPI003867F6D6|nr:MbtH family protein [Embleya sp. NBC_00896]
MSDTPTNPFDGDHGGEGGDEFRVLVNELGQHSLWPGFAAVPAGWTVAHGPCARSVALDWITAHWTDLSPVAR